MTPAEMLAALPAQLRRTVTEKHVKPRLAVLRAREGFVPYPWQRLPEHMPTLGAVLLMGGRGTGKSRCLAQAVIEHAYGPACDPKLPGGHRIGLIGPTLGDLVESIIKGPSGIITHDQTARLRLHTGGTHLYFGNGAEAKLFGGHNPDDVERLRAGGNRCAYYIDELAAIRMLAGILEHSAMGLRIGPNPHYVMATTPKPRRELRELISRPSTVLLRGKTSQAIHMPQAWRDQMTARYAGTRQGLQELDGEILEDVEGALWNLYGIAASTVHPRDVPPLVKIVAVMDRADTATKTSDECGLVAVALGTDDHIYVTHDYSGTFAGLQAGRRAWDLFHDSGADLLLYEQRNEWVADILRLAWDGHGKPPIDHVHAKESKFARAKPAAALWETDPAQAHFVGELPALAEQCSTWTVGAFSPDRLDAMVHGIHHLVDLSPPDTGYRSPYRAFSAYS